MPHCCSSCSPTLPLKLPRPSAAPLLPFELPPISRPTAFPSGCPQHGRSLHAAACRIRWAAHVLRSQAAHVGRAVSPLLPARLPVGRGLPPAGGWRVVRRPRDRYPDALARPRSQGRLDPARADPRRGGARARAFRVFAAAPPPRQPADPAPAPPRLRRLSRGRRGPCQRPRRRPSQRRRRRGRLRSGRGGGKGGAHEAQGTRAAVGRGATAVAAAQAVARLVRAHAGRRGAVDLPVAGARPKRCQAERDDPLLGPGRLPQSDTPYRRGAARRPPLLDGIRFAPPLAPRRTPRPRRRRHALPRRARGAAGGPGGSPLERSPRRLLRPRAALQQRLLQDALSCQVWHRRRLLFD
mmetsp:Transcript_62427/g.185718  ORF Transcript_62427/g.185718 Transcript_62427/m.185718 type:complete len:353 (-) Transcript_62427:944-2002(-)